MSGPGADTEPPVVARTPDRTTPEQLDILLVGPSLDYVGGQAVQLQRLLRRLGSTPGVRPQFLPVNPRLGMPWRALQRVRYVRTVITSAAYAFSLVRRVPGADVVHAFSASYWSFLLAPVPALVVARFAGRPSILNYRSGEASDHLERWGWLVIPLMRLAGCIVVPSGYLVSVFARHGLTAVAIPNFVELESIPYRRRQHVRPVFLANRNFEPLYNVACVLRAFSRIQARHPHASLAVVGDGPEGPALRRLAAELGLQHVTFCGRVVPGDMARYYDAADIYLNAPNIDNMPNSILEAFAAGLPVVSSDAGGIPWIVRTGENGLLVPCDDDAALADAALGFLADPARALRMADRGRAEVTEKYAWPAVEAAWLACYSGLAVPAGSRA